MVSTNSLGRRRMERREICASVHNDPATTMRDQGYKTADPMERTMRCNVRRGVNMDGWETEGWFDLRQSVVACRRCSCDIDFTLGSFRHTSAPRVLFAWRHHSQTTRPRMASIRTKSRKSAAAPTDCFTRRAERSKRFAESIAEGNHRPSRASLYTTLGIIFVFTLAGVVAMNLGPVKPTSPRSKSACRR